jgi:hypothetical protein
MHGRSGALNDNAYRVRAERGQVQLGTWVTMIRTPAVLTLLRGRAPDDRAGGDHYSSDAAVLRSS